MINLDTFEELVFEPRLTINFKVANYLRAEILGEFKSQYTNQVIDLEQNFLGIERRRWTLSDNEELPLTKSKQGSIGLNYIKNSLYIGLEGFYKQVEGISAQTQGFQNQNQFDDEIGSYQVKGLEFLINKKGVNYSTWLSYTFNKNDYTFEEYFRADASATYGFDLSTKVKANVGISLLNLTSRKNVLNRYYRVNEDNEIEQVNNFSLGFTPNVNFRISF